VVFDRSWSLNHVFSPEASVAWIAIATSQSKRNDPGLLLSQAYKSVPAAKSLCEPGEHVNHKGYAHSTPLLLLHF